jgi:hypothetical protein
MGKVTFYNQGNVEQVECEDYNTIIHDCGWRTYIVGYHRKSGEIRDEENSNWLSNK